MSDWIKCSDGVPTERESFDKSSTVDVLVCTEAGNISIAFWSCEGLCWADQCGEQIDEEEWGFITHWMPLPKAP